MTLKMGAYFVVRRHCVMYHFRQAQNGIRMHPPHDPKAIGVEAKQNIVTATFDFHFDNEARYISAESTTQLKCVLHARKIPLKTCPSLLST